MHRCGCTFCFVAKFRSLLHHTGTKRWRSSLLTALQTLLINSSAAKYRVIASIVSSFITAPARPSTPQPKFGDFRVTSLLRWRVFEDKTDGDGGWKDGFILIRSDKRLEKESAERPHGSRETLYQDWPNGQGTQKPNALNFKQEQAALESKRKSGLIPVNPTRRSKGCGLYQDFSHIWIKRITISSTFIASDNVYNNFLNNNKRKNTANKHPHQTHTLPDSSWNFQKRKKGKRHSSGAVWESRWTSWAVRPNEPSGFRGRKELLNRASALVTTCP